ncbi:pyrroline-5-carboxylate reductase family protein [Mangrovibacterium sp.]|uniref:pyrroline-5-carboxylate reductase family protein n=1 Tax=Mangrovibacterium sp. TaxID=1961364 RepID=UPI00356427CC
MKTKSLGFIGGGRITKIFLQALANKQIDLSSVLVCDTNAEVLNALKKQFPKIQTTDSCTVAAKQDVVFIALHPPVIMDALEQIKAAVSEKTQVVSFAPKISIEKLASKLLSKNIARMIPNATSYINEGFNPISFSAEFPANEKQALVELLNILGNTFETEESKLEAYALVSAMLPTYFWFQWQEMQKLGVQMGLTASESKETIQQTLSAAIDLYFNSGLSGNEVMDLIPVKPIGEHETQISEIYQTKLMGLFQKIKP